MSDPILYSGTSDVDGMAAIADRLFDILWRIVYPSRISYM